VAQGATGVARGAAVTPYLRTMHPLDGWLARDAGWPRAVPCELRGNERAAREWLAAWDARAQCDGLRRAAA
jgi:hypothetical protein